MEVCLVYCTSCLQMQWDKRKQRYWLDEGENEICICVLQMTLKCMIGMS